MIAAGKKNNLSYIGKLCFALTMRKPSLLELEFTILLAVVGGGMLYSTFRGLFALISD